MYPDNYEIIHNVSHNGNFVSLARRETFDPFDGSMSSRTYEVNWQIDGETNYNHDLKYVAPALAIFKRKVETMLKPINLYNLIHDKQAS
ncbi:hypothetical protein GAP31_072 [Cronobacter phage vB_CsaM_GAP31]|uniref:Uncharacterized protein n=1 Tax=Cronobacter phage vB_CsaM_GAP31 TaxID=1141135 RepID=K4F5T1_9CAUD|nr:hypothetical protein GAP31_072 [Cronobacter phage vB_CsaM_GAP31]AFC21253.1 hypothetical protein GAP31_072 [Cronobacter phage vB_CsaM_GAP31]